MAERQCYSCDVREPEWNVRSLFDRTVSLLRERPLLALPVVIADLLSFAVMHLQHALHDPLFALFFSHRDSVLSGSRSTFSLTPENASEAALLVIPLLWASYFISIYLYTMALLAVSSLVGTTEDGKVPHWRLVHSSLVEKKRLLLRSALLVFGLAILSTVAAGALFWVVLHIPVLKQKMGFELGAIVGLFVEVPFALYIAGPALMLLRSTEVPPSLGSVRLARNSAVAAVIAQTSVILLINRAPNSLLDKELLWGFLFRRLLYRDGLCPIFHFLSHFPCWLRRAIR